MPEETHKEINDEYEPMKDLKEAVTNIPFAFERLNDFLKVVLDFCFKGYLWARRTTTILRSNMRVTLFVFYNRKMTHLL